MKSRKFSTSKTEIIHLTIAWMGVSVAFSMSSFRYGYDISQALIVSLVGVGSAFIFHELAHKFTAQYYGYWSEFRMNPNMLIFAVLLASMTGVVFAAPGAVQIFGMGVTRSQNGKISVSGAVINILLVLLFLPFTNVAGFVGAVARYGAFINSMVAAFNMIPFGVLDGRKVLMWNPKVFLMILVVAFGMVYVTWSLVYGMI